MVTDLIISILVWPVLITLTRHLWEARTHG